MPDTKIVIHVKNKQSLINFAQDKVTKAEAYAQELLNVLIEIYGAYPPGIDHELLLQEALGTLISCTIKETSMPAPADYVAWRLSSYSDIGLKKCGLTRDKYTQAVSGIIGKTTFKQAVAEAVKRAQDTGKLCYLLKHDDLYFIDHQYRDKWLFRAYPGGRKEISRLGCEVINRQK